MQTGIGLTGAERELSAISLPALRNEDVSRGERNLWCCSCLCLFGSEQCEKTRSEEELRLVECVKKNRILQWSFFDVIGVKEGSMKPCCWVEHHG